MMCCKTRTQHDHCMLVHGIVDSIEVADVLAGMDVVDSHLLDVVHGKCTDSKILSAICKLPLLQALQSQLGTTLPKIFFFSLWVAIRLEEFDLAFESVPSLALTCRLNLVS